MNHKQSLSLFWCKIFGHDFYIRRSGYRKEGITFFNLQCRKCGKRLTRKYINLPSILKVLDPGEEYGKLS